MNEKPANYDYTAAKREAAYKKRVKKAGRLRFERIVTPAEFEELDKHLAKMRGLTITEN